MATILYEPQFWDTERAKYFGKYRVKHGCTLLWQAAAFFWNKEYSMLFIDNPVGTHA